MSDQTEGEHFGCVAVLRKPAVQYDTRWKVIEAADAVGYENQGKFAKVFAEVYGVSPLEFRRLSK